MSHEKDAIAHPLMTHRSSLLLYPVHGVEEVFALRVDADAEPLALCAKMFFERARGFTRARHVGDDDHRKLALHDCLIDVNDAATRFRQNLRHARDDARMIYAEDGDNQAALRIAVTRPAACAARNAPSGILRREIIASIRLHERLNRAVNVRHELLDRFLIRTRAEPPVDSPRDAINQFFISHLMGFQICDFGFAID